METKQFKEDDVVGYRLVIGRVPKNTYTRFKEYANDDDFCADFGLALKSLLDFYYGLVPVGTEHLELQINELRMEIEQLKSKQSEKNDEKKAKVMANGKVIG